MGPRVFAPISLCRETLISGQRPMRHYTRVSILSNDGTIRCLEGFFASLLLRCVGTDRSHVITTLRALEIPLWDNTLPL